MTLRTLLEIFGVVAAVSLVLAVLGLAYAWRRLRRMRFPRDAEFFTTVRAVPLSLVIGIDLLDLALDVLSGPIIWVFLDRLGLRSLRNVATYKALIPVSNVIPLLTLCWIAARVFNLGHPLDPNLIEAEKLGPGRYVARPRQP
jgi:hypothetical protein